MTNIQSPNPASGDGLDPKLDGLNPAQQAGVSNDTDPIMQDIEAMFGSNDPSAASGDGLGASGSKDVDDLFGITPTKNSGEPQQTKSSFDGMTAEQRAAHFQSLYNKLENETKQFKPQYEKYKSVADFVNQVYEDPQVKQAFLAELAPDLVQPKDPYDALQEHLAKEFGEDFVPDEDEAQKPLSKSWRYLKRVDELYTKLSKEQPQVPKSIKELREERERMLREANEQAERERAEILNDMKWSTSDWNEFSNWAIKLKGKHLARWYQHLRKQKGSAPNLMSHSGGSPVRSIPEVFQELDNFFGK